MVCGRLALANLVAASVLAVSFSTSAGAADVSPAAMPPVGPLAWEGFYAGGAIGSEDSAFGGGIQAGYNHRLDPKWLIGVEGELSWTSQNDSQSNNRWFDSLDARLGYTLGPWLLYVKGGAAFTNNDVSNNTTGFSVGGGVEYMFARHWSAKAEYEHLDFGSNNNNGRGRGGDNQVNEFKVGVNYHFAPGTLFGLK